MVSRISGIMDRWDIVCAGAGVGGLVGRWVVGFVGWHMGRSVGLRVGRQVVRCEAGWDWKVDR